jgi:pSer/pThr/pTyr-binding forkhead associated (FHA) protein
MIPPIQLDDEPIGLLYVMVESERSCYILTKSKAKIKVGRHPSCEIQIMNSSMSREHFSINMLSSDLIGKHDGEYQFELEDLKSFNKTKRNGEVIDKGLLKDGDIIEAGVVRIKFRSLVSR